MDNPLIDRIGCDLGVFKDAFEDTYTYNSRLFYTAMSEWIRTICNDADPMMGNCRAGVSYEYLLSRAMETMRELFLCVGRAAIESQMREQLEHLVNGMIEFGELWETANSETLHTVALPPIAKMDCFNGYTRIVGPRDKIQGNVLYSGFSRWVKGTVTPDVTEGQKIAIKSLMRFSAKPVSSLHAAYGQAICHNLNELLEQSGGWDISRQGNNIIILSGAKAQSYNPVKEYLKALTWPIASPYVWESKTKLAIAKF